MTRGFPYPLTILLSSTLPKCPSYVLKIRCTSLPVPPHIRKRWEKQISDGQEVKKRIASKQRHEWKRKARLLVPSPPLTEATPVTKNLCRIYKYE